MGTLHLSDSDQAELGRAARVLASPFEHADVDAWRRAVNRTLKPLLGADKATFQFPGEGASDLISDGLSPEDLSKYLPNIRKFQKRLWTDPHAVFDRAVALRVCDRSSLYGEDLERYFRSEYHNEYIRRIRAFDALMAAVPLPGRRLPAELYFHHDRPHGGTFGPKPLALLRLLHPAFEAGVRAQVAFGAHRHRLASMLDGVRDGAVLLDLAGNLLHRNRTAAALLESDPGRDGIEAALRKVSEGFRDLQPPERWDPRARPAETVTRTVRTGLGRYRLWGSLMDGGQARPLVVVLIAAPRRERPPDPRELVQQFGLTGRQAEVALLLARRRSNREISEALSISPHTARHHTEMVLRKLGISSRREVGRVVFGGFVGGPDADGSRP